MKYTVKKVSAELKKMKGTAIIIYVIFLTKSLDWIYKGNNQLTDHVEYSTKHTNRGYQIGQQYCQ